ncbi:hypothetical protein V6Z11_A01G094400 [Gossypium hirsutum]
MEGLLQAGSSYFYYKYESQGVFGRNIFTSTSTLSSTFASTITISPSSNSFIDRNTYAMMQS